MKIKYIFLLITLTMNSIPDKIVLDNLSTEKRNKNTMNLDIMSSLEIAKAMNNEDKNVPLAIEKVLPNIAKVIDLAAESIKNGGRIFYIGAGTSGRLSIADAAECPPTFSVTPDKFIGIMCGGNNAVFKAVEGAEDHSEYGIKDLKINFLNNKDLVIGVAASGRTPYVIGGLKYAKEIGCKTASISCNINSEISKLVDVSIEAIVGPEVLTGSTRLKAGTAQKLILNMISTGAMIKNGKVYQNLMVDVMMTNKKLKVRGENIIMEATGVNRDIAKEMIEKSNGSVKIAIVMILGNYSYDEAIKKLNENGGQVRKAIEK